MIIAIDTKIKPCITWPNLTLVIEAERIYTIYDLSGICSCGKHYAEHPHFVKENEERMKKK